MDRLWPGGVVPARVTELPDQCCRRIHLSLICSPTTNKRFCRPMSSFVSVGCRFLPFGDTSKMADCPRPSPEDNAAAF